MTSAELDSLKLRLISAATQYDIKQSKRPGYNRYALAQYMGRIDEVCEDIGRGADPAEAIARGFLGTLRAALLRGAKLAAKPDAPGAVYYRPVTGE